MSKEEVEDIAEDIAFAILNSSFEDVGEYDTLKEIIMKELSNHFHINKQP